MSRDGRGRGGRGGAVEGGKVLISTTIAGLGRGLVVVDRMARPPPTALMRQPRHHDGEGGDVGLYGSVASLHSRERRDCTRHRQWSGAARRAVCSDGMDHHDEGAAGESKEMTIDLLWGRELQDPLQPSFRFFFSSVTHLVPPSSPWLWGHIHCRPTLQ